MHDRPHRLLLGVDDQVGLGGGLVRVVHAREALDLAVARALVHAALVRPLAVLEGGGDVDEVEVAVLLDELARVLAGVLEWRDGRGDDGGAGARQLRGHEGDTADVLVAVLLGEAELGRELGPHRLAQQHGDGAAALLVERHLQSAGDLVLARVHVARQEDGEALLRPRRVRLAEDLNDLGVREPLRNLAAGPEPGAQLGTGDIEGADALGDGVDGRVLVAIGQVGHHLEGNDLDAEFVTVLLDRVLGVIGSVEVDTLAVLARTGVVTTDDEVGRTVVLADDGVPDGLTRTTHTHSQRQQTQDCHSVGVSREKGLVHSHTSEVVDVTRLGKTNDRVDENIGVVGTSGANRQLTVRSVHGVTGLESNDASPAQFVEVQTDFSGSICLCISVLHNFPQTQEVLLTSKIDKVVVLQAVHGLQLTTDVELSSGVVEVLNGRVLLITSEDLLSLKSPVRQS